MYCEQIQNYSRVISDALKRYIMIPDAFRQIQIQKYFRDISNVLNRCKMIPDAFQMF
jgi:hypothetical protein